MTYHGLLEYIRAAKDRGVSDVDITMRLHAAGWYKVDIHDALELYARLNTKSADTAAGVTPTPSLVDRIAPRRYDIHLVAILSFVIGYFAYVWLMR